MRYQTQQCVECGVRTEKQTLEFKGSVKLCWNLHRKYIVPKEGSTKFCIFVQQVYHYIVHMYCYNYAYSV